jgi:GTP-binding protein Era
MSLDEFLAASIKPSASATTGDKRCGLIAIVGKPNVGKSTLLNALVGQKVSITSRKAQTTRHRITGIRTIAPTQFVFVDTPGFQTRHSNELNKALNKTVTGAINDVDLILFVVEAGRVSSADAKVLELFGKDIPCILVANKLDLAGKRSELAPWLQTMQGEQNDKGFTFAELFPMTAKNKRDVERLLELCAQYLPEQDWLYGDDELTDRSERFMAAEIVREKLFRLTGDELPYTSTVVIDEFKEEVVKNAKGNDKPAMKRIAATIIVERDGHKAMVIGDKGERLKRIGTEARTELEKLTGSKVFLQLWVKVKSGWADDAARLKTYGYE